MTAIMTTTVMSSSNCFQPRFNPYYFYYYYLLILLLTCYIPLTVNSTPLTTTTSTSKLFENDETTPALSLLESSNDDKHHRRLPLLRRGNKRNTNSTILQSNNKGNPIYVPPPAQWTVPLHANEASHHVLAYIGSPPQQQTLIVDTGSRLVAFPCKPCRTCGTQSSSPMFDPAISTTRRLVKCGSCHFDGISKCKVGNDRCTLSQSYSEGSSWSAEEVQDIVWFGNNDTTQSIEDFLTIGAVPFTFGCQTRTTGLFKSQYANGILGVGRHESSFVNALYKANVIPHPSFSLCMSPTGGTFSVGGTLPIEYHTSPMKMVPILSIPGLYSVKVVQVNVIHNNNNNNTTICVARADGTIQQQKGLNAMNSRRGTILDSGTTDTFLPRQLAPILQDGINEILSSNNSNITAAKLFNPRKQSWTYQEFLLYFPDIQLVFENNIMFDIPAAHYMEGIVFTNDHATQVEPWTGKIALINRLYLDEPLGAVLGANALMGYDILYHSDYVGIAKANCPTLSLHPSTIVTNDNDNIIINKR